MPRISRAKIKIAKVRKPRKTEQPKEELVDNCDQCGQPLAIGRLRTTGSAVCVMSEIGDSRTRTLRRRKFGESESKWYFFDSQECCEIFRKQNPMPGEWSHKLGEHGAGS